LAPSRTAGTVLIIDDNEVLCGAVSIALRTQGFLVLEAHDGRSGVDLFQVHHAVIDVIVMDLTLPLLSGREALRQLHQIRPGVKVILTTSFSKDSAWRTLGFESLEIPSKTVRAKRTGRHVAEGVQTGQ
jgi:two-component system, cell cycle sensor histidine kinase and response regulator CckA